MRKHLVIKKKEHKLLIDKDILKFFPEPEHMKEPAPTLWEKPSIVQDLNKSRQVVRNSNSY